MLKVVHVAAAAERGGREVIMLNIVRTLDRSRYLPVVVFLTDGPFVEEVSRTGTETRVIEAGRVRHVLKARRAVAEIAKVIRFEKAALVHTHDSKAHIYGGLAARIVGVPTLLHLQGVPKPSLSRDGFVSLLSVLVPARKTIACSSYVAEAFRSAWPVRRDIFVVHSGILPRVEDASADLRKELGIPDAAPLVVLATRLQHWKGVHVFIDAAAQVRRARPDARFMVVGGALFGLEPNYAAQLRRQADDLGLGEAMLFTGFRQDVSRFYAAADIVTHCSISPDPFPTVLLEAMSWGKPVVASDSGGPREIVKHKETGLLVPPGRPESLAHAVLDLLGNTELRERMGRAGAARVRSEFQAVLMATRIQLLYEELAGTPGFRGKGNGQG